MQRIFLYGYSHTEVLLCVGFISDVCVEGVVAIERRRFTHLSCSDSLNLADLFLGGPDVNEEEDW